MKGWTFGPCLDKLHAPKINSMHLATCAVNKTPLPRVCAKHPLHAPSAWVRYIHVMCSARCNCALIITHLFAL